jgi:hypothetical protein
LRSTNAEFLALKIRLNDLEITVDSNIHELLWNVDHTMLEQLKFQVTDPCGSIAKLEHELTDISNKFESGGGVDSHSSLKDI